VGRSFGESWFGSWQEQKIFLFYTVSRLSLQPIQPPTEWALRALFLWVKKLGYEADHPPLSSAKVKNEWSCMYTLSSALMACQTSAQERKHRLEEPTKILGSKHEVITKTNTHTQINCE